MKEVEEGTPRYDTIIIKDPREIIKATRLILDRSNQVSVCVTTTAALEFSYNNFFDIKKKLVVRQKNNGNPRGIRYLCIVNDETEIIVRSLLNAGFQVRHIKNMPPMSFLFTDKEVMTTIVKLEGARSFLMSNGPEYVEHFSTIFEELWEKGIDAKDRIEALKQGEEIDDELFDAKRYLNEVLQVVGSMENRAVTPSQK